MADGQDWELGRRIVDSAGRMIEEHRGSCHRGLTQDEVRAILYDHFREWMFGQTEALCEEHGLATYGCDLERYLKRWPVID